MTDADYADDLAVLADTLKDATTLLHNIEKVAKQIELYLNADKTVFICENQDASIAMKSLADKKYQASTRFQISMQLHCLH